MRAISISAIALVWSAAVGMAQDTTHTAPKEQTLAGWHGFQALHIDFGGGNVPSGNRHVGVAVIRLTAAFSALPAWSFSWFGQEGLGQSTSFNAPGLEGYYPDLLQSVNGLGVERRWNNTRALHPYVGASTGTVTNSFDHSYFLGSPSQQPSDEKQSTPFLGINAGAELNIAHWVRLSVAVGYRAASKYTWSHGSLVNSGQTVTTLIEFGKF